MEDLFCSYIVLIQPLTKQVFIRVSLHDIIEVPDYKAILHSRVDNHHKDERYYGGAYILLRNYLLND